MKLKEINRTAMLSWSPAQHYPVYLASGTSAQQLDASFSTNASLEFFELNLADPSLDMKSCGTLSTSYRYHKLVWSSFGTDGESLRSGVLIAGGENGNVILYDPAKIMAGDNDVVIAESDRHTGPVRALDINPFQTNLVASGGNESEIYIWDLNNFGSPMTPGPKTQTVEDISCVAWNRQVQHILASSSPSGRTSVWDLRKNDLIIKVGDHSNRVHCSGMAWNPEVATQLVMASEDDRMPVVQMWDLRFATSPLKVFENHTRGVLAIAWSSADPELLLSCGKDCRILCWNPNSAEILYELPTGNQWCFDIQWCPRNPAVFSASGFDGYMNIYSIMGGTSQAQTQRHVDQISNSFSTIDPFGTGQTLPPLELPQSATLPSTVNPLKKPPKWTRTPAGASFAFGGKLVSLDNEKRNVQQSTPYVVHVSQVVTETDLMKRSNQLEATLSSGQFVEFCQEKIKLTGNDFEKTVWSFLKANFDNDSRTRFLELLGYKKEELALKIADALTEKQAEVDFLTPCDAQPAADPSIVSAADTSEEECDLISTADQQQAAPQELVFAPDTEAAEKLVEMTEVTAFDLIASENTQPTIPLELDSVPPVKSEDEVNAEETDALFQGGIDEKLDQAPDGLTEVEWDEEEIILEEEVTEPVTGIEAPSEDVLQSLGEVALQDPCVEVCETVEQLLDGDEVLKKAEDNASQVVAHTDTAGLCINQDVDGLITQALLTGNFEGAVELCLHDNRMADGIILAIAGGTELLEKTKKKYFQKSQSKLNKLVSAVVMKDLREILNTCELQNWKEALAAVMTYAQPQEFFSLCDLLGGRLEDANDAQLKAQACLCYICAGNVEKLVSCWTKTQEGNGPLVLQDLVEKVVVMRHAAEQTQRSGPISVGVLLAKQMSEYANLLASQGCLSTAITYLPDETNQQLRKRLIHALGQQETTPQSIKEPPAPAKPNTFSALQSTTAASAQPQYYQPVRAASTVTSWSNQTPTAFPHAPTSLPPGTTTDQAKVDPPNPMYGMPAIGTAAAAPSSASVMYSHQYQRPQNGWNDPPTLSRVPKKMLVPENYTPPAPITAPIMAPLGVDPQGHHIPSGSPQYVGQIPQAVQAPYSNMQLPHASQATNSLNTAMPKTSTEGPPGAPTGEFMQPLQTMPAEKITKKPIPDEHLVLKTTFEGLIQKCLAATNEPQTKRKLDDANKRMEALYDKLREQTLSPAIVGGLHNIARTIDSRSYTEGLNLHTHIVSSSNFSEISGFMPVLKVVLTQASKLGV